MLSKLTVWSYKSNEVFILLCLSNKIKVSVFPANFVNKKVMFLS